WLTLPKPKADYKYDQLQPGHQDVIYQIIKETLDMLPDDINLADFDNDGDGMLDAVSIIHQGPGQEATGNVSDIWSQMVTLDGSYEIQGIKIGPCSLQPEIEYGQQSSIGVFAHEFGHLLGSPDFYDAGHSGYGKFPGSGDWDLMASGSWNGNHGNRPAGINPWEKWKLGWLTPIELTEDAKIESLKAGDKVTDCYKVNTRNNGEFFILENRQKNGCFDSGLPGHGLLIYHVNENAIRDNLQYNLINAFFPQGLYVVNAAAVSDPSSTAISFGNINSDTAPFPGTTNATEFSNETIPSSSTYDGYASCVKIYNISESEGEISFELEKSNSDQLPPFNFNAAFEAGAVKLTWDEPAEMGNFSHYVVSRNGSKVASLLTEPFYIDEKPLKGVDYYTVFAVNNDNVRSEEVSASVFVQDSRISSISLKQNKGVDVVLKLNTKVFRSPIDSETFLYETTGPVGTFCVKYLASELIPYIGE
ncbi:MAG: M6 family metalloprotease domain-containing protein, partial [Bacteroidaceae bacterium]|nr:M6 family metalloprotease domain-containing protein [Bacteroidaceae bacterium]